MKLLMMTAPALLALAACSADPAETPEETSEEAAVEAEPELPPLPNAAPDAPLAEDGTMPLAVRGTFAEAAVEDPDPTGEACDPALETVITIVENGYEVAGSTAEIREVESQGRTSIFAIFDATREDSDEIVTTREGFTESDGGRTLRRSIIGGENAGNTRYRYCADA